MNKIIAIFFLFIAYTSSYARSLGNDYWEYLSVETKDTVEEDSMGYSILRENDSFSEQMVHPNTIYVIKYDFNLGDEAVKIPIGSTLMFEGGGISHGEIIGQNTLLCGDVRLSCALSGVFKNEYISPIWFGADNSGKKDSTEAIQAAINSAGECSCKRVYLIGGTYLITSPLLVYRNKNIDFCGEGKSTVIMANAKMESMITSGTKGSNQYIGSSFHDFFLDGNREGGYVISSSGITANEPLADRGMFFPNGFIYSFVKNVFFRNLNYGIHAERNWGVVYEGLDIRRCNYGIISGTPNGTKIINSEFGTIGEFGAVVAGGNTCVVQNNIFESIGKSAVVVCAQSRGHIINNNYFEGCSIMGVNLTAYQNRYDIDDVHACVLLLGSNGGDLKQLKGARYSCVRTYSIGGISICNNSVQGDQGIVFASSLFGGYIADNISALEDIPVLSTLLDGSSCLVFDVEISRNIYHANRGLLKKIKILKTTAYQNVNTLKHVYSNDVDSDIISRTNLTNRCVLQGIASKGSTLYLKELGFRYKGNRVFEAVGNGTLRISANYQAYFDRFDINELDPDSVIIATYYKKTTADNSVVWEEQFMNFKTVSQVIAAIPVENGDIITLPVCYIAGANQQDIDDYVPVCASRYLNYPTTVHYLENTKIVALDNKFVNGLLVSYANNDIDNEMQTTVISNDLIGSTSELSDETKNAPTVYKGVTLIDAKTFKRLCWNGSSWVDATGAPIYDN